MNTATTLEELIRACVDDERTLLHERTFVDAQRAETLTRMARERDEFVQDLERLGAPARKRESGSWVELLREAGRDVWVSAAGLNNGDAIAACRHSRARTEARYDTAMQWPWPDKVWRVLEAQRRRLQDDADELNHIQF